MPLRKAQTSPISLIDYNLNPDAVGNNIRAMHFCSSGIESGMDCAGGVKFPSPVELFRPDRI
ncbi:MAG TPA: hypothetical protein VF798_01160 [Burkholderiaceae bacterium]